MTVQVVESPVRARVVPNSTRRIVIGFALGLLLLYAGVRLWLRQALPSGCPPACGGLNLSKRDLSGIDFTGADLTAANLSGSNLTRATLTNATLVGANLSESILMAATLTGADLKAANLTGANLVAANFLPRSDRGLATSLTEAVMRSVAQQEPALPVVPRVTTLEGVNFNEALLNRVNLEGLNLTASTFVRAQLVGANLVGADLHGGDLTEADLTGSNLDRANLSAVLLRGANLQGVTGNGTSFVGADMSGTTMMGANLSQADLRGANISGSDLSGAVLRGANLTGSDLSRTWLSAADLSLTNLNESNLFATDMTGAILRGATLVRTDLRGTYLLGANIEGADLRWAYFIKIDLQDGSSLNEMQLLNMHLQELLLLNDKSVSLQEALNRIARLSVMLDKLALARTNGEVDLRFTTVGDLLDLWDISYTQFRATRFLELLGVPASEIDLDAEDAVNGLTLVELLQESDVEIAQTLTELEPLRLLLSQLNSSRRSGVDILNLTFTQLLDRYDLDLAGLVQSKFLEALGLSLEEIDLNGVATDEFTLLSNWYTRAGAGRFSPPPSPDAR